MLSTIGHFLNEIRTFSYQEKRHHCQRNIDFFSAYIAITEVDGRLRKSLKITTQFSQSIIKHTVPQ